MEHVALFAFGLALLAAGAPLLVFGAARLDRATGRNAFAVGAVAACFGPCVAGLAFDLAAVLRHPPVTRLAVGHLVGSNVASVGLVLGLAAFVRPIAATARTFYTAVPLALGAALLFWFLARNAPVLPLSRAGGGVLLGGAAVALGLLIRALRSEPDGVRAEFAGWVPERQPVWAAILLALAGLAGLVGGAYLTASELAPVAVHLGGLPARTHVPLGELAALVAALPTAIAAAVAARRGRSDLVLAVVVFPLIFNSLLVGGAVAMVQPLVIDDWVILDAIPVAAIFALLLLPVLFNGLRVPRWEGALLLAAYAGFITWQVRGALR